MSFIFWLSRVTRVELFFEKSYIHNSRFLRYKILFSSGDHLASSAFSCQTILPVSLEKTVMSLFFLFSVVVKEEGLFINVKSSKFFGSKSLFLISLKEE